MRGLFCVSSGAATPTILYWSNWMNLSRGLRTLYAWKGSIPLRRMSASGVQARKANYGSLIPLPAVILLSGLHAYPAGLHDTGFDTTTKNCSHQKVKVERLGVRLKRVGIEVCYN